MGPCGGRPGRALGWPFVPPPRVRGAGLRFGLAALVFVAIALVLRLRRPRGPDLWFTVLWQLPPRHDAGHLTVTAPDTRSLA